MKAIPSTLRVSDETAQELFRKLALHYGIDPRNAWVGGYVAYEWDHNRHVFQAYNTDIEEMRILEFGCNIGASAIVLAHLGARVTAIDIDRRFVELAKANAAMYGLQDRIKFVHVTDTSSMPFEEAVFDMINCNSVLEYVPSRFLNSVQHEIDRVLKRNGIIVVTGTSNRLWPKEMHSGKWIANYIPVFLDSVLFSGKHIVRGVFPWKIRYGFGAYENVDLTEHGSSFLESKRRMGMSRQKLLFLKLLNSILWPLGVWVGSLAPSLTLTLRKY